MLLRLELLCWQDLPGPPLSSIPCEAPTAMTELPAEGQHNITHYTSIIHHDSCLSCHFEGTQFYDNRVSSELPAAGYAATLIAVRQLVVGHPAQSLIPIWVSARPLVTHRLTRCLMPDHACM
jgi:hypothetical protein